MENIKTKVITFSLALLFSASAYSSAFNYSEIHAGIETFSVGLDGVPDDLDGNGFLLGAWYSVNDNIALTLDYGDSSGDATVSGFKIDLDVDGFQVGALLHTPINNETDFFAGFALIEGDIETSINGTPVLSEDASGNSIYLGVRAMVSEVVELNAMLNRSDIENETDTDLSIGGRFYFSEQVSVNGVYTDLDDGETIAVTLSVYY